jgi:hypothetical protein
MATIGLCSCAVVETLQVDELDIGAASCFGGEFGRASVAREE